MLNCTLKMSKMYFKTITNFKINKFLKSLKENIDKNLPNISMTSKIKAITENFCIYKNRVNAGCHLLLMYGYFFHL